ncbi:MAG: glycosyltransferase family 4 protein [Muribaculaceae bacterium]|nr:glycosyltransferase family 4 protein [Muribaculaceae bacterium]
MARILFINNSYPTPAFPAAGTYARTMAEEMEQAGHTVDVEALRPSGNGALHKIRDYASFWKRLLSRKLGGYDLLYVNHFTYSFPLFLNPTLRKNAAKVIIHWHGKELVSTSKFNAMMVQALDRSLRDFRHVAPSEYFKNKILAATALDPSQIIVSPSGGVDISLFRPRSDGKAEEAFILGFPGGIITTKGADVLLGVMQAHRRLERATGRPVKFRIIHYGAEFDVYLPRFRASGAELEIMPKMSKEQMPDFYSGLSVALTLSSAVIGESLGLVSLEAMGCGVPVIAHDICAYPEFVIPGRSGELATYSPDPAERTAGVLDAIERIAANPSSYAPREIIEQGYSRESVVDFYRNALL